MQDVLQALRGALELQQAIQGQLIPLGSAKPIPNPVDLSNSKKPGIERTTTPAIPPETEPLDTMPNSDLFGNEIDPLQDASLTPYKRIQSLIPTESPLHVMQSLEEVSEYVANTILIPLDETRIKPVFGVGNPNSDLLVIGEAPGADEDKQGEPFVGRAGQLLNKILAAINFERDQIYIANILKSRPPNNRDPLPEEVEAHIPILYKQIALIQPKIILCVGKTAGNRLLQTNATLGSLRGKFNDFHGLPVMVTYHPAALLRNPNWKRHTWEDVQLLRSRFDELVDS